MPSFRHESFVELFRKNAQLAPELLQTCVGIAIDHARVEPDSIDLTQVAPTAYFADAVSVLRDRDNRPVTGLIVEVQLRADEDKLLSWPVYVSTLRAKHGCAALLLVVAPDPAVAAWARQPIDLGHPGFRLTPIVVELADVPQVRDRAVASRLPELATLSAMAHPELEIAEVAIEAISSLPADRSRLCLDVLLNALPAEIRRRLEAPMEGYKYQSDFARKYYGQGHEEGLEKGVEKGLRAALVAFARARLGPLPDADIAAIEAVADQRVLTGLVASLGRARSAAKARAALDRALGRQKIARSSRGRG